MCQIVRVLWVESAVAGRGQGVEEGSARTGRSGSGVGMEELCWREGEGGYVTGWGLAEEESVVERGGRQ